MAVPDFHTWVGRMANSIEDTSIVSKASGVIPLTRLQKRAYVADLCVPVISNEHQLADWLSIFRVKIVDGNLTTGMLSTLIGMAEVGAYNDCDTEDEEIKWLNSLRKKISMGWLPS
jgi:hypothetical protein